MVWPFSSGGTGDGGSTPTPQLDPSLQEFLKQQGPSSYKPAASSSPQPSPPSQPSNASPTLAPSDTTDTSDRPQYASRSLFTDGRYDHLWKTYQSQTEVESRNKSDQEKMDDVLQAYKDRKGSIKSAAMENCSPEAIAQWNCNNYGSWAKRSTMCRAETQAMGRCLDMQARFLRALGYLTEYGRPREQEEDIQLHADDLYRAMLVREKASAEARDAGRPEPVFAPILGATKNAGGKGPLVLPSAGIKPGVVDTPDDPALPMEAEGMKPAAVEMFKDRLRPLGPAERELERAALAHEIRQATLTDELYQTSEQKVMKQRQDRRNAGTATVGDRIAGIFGR